ncbi:hypothetical protein BC830DRAFT_681018 [Chytriomyces sp. MP71]|nr:hypothetical protein BC830DRAFT_681018 [Chytriomyces sp. MP71]
MPLRAADRRRRSVVVETGAGDQFGRQQILSKHKNRRQRSDGGGWADEGTRRGAQRRGTEGSTDPGAIHGGGTLGPKNNKEWKMRWATDQTGGTTTTRRREVVHRRSALWTPLGGRENEDSGGETEDVVGSGLSETDDDDEASNPSPVTLATTASKRALYCGVAEGGDARGSGATPSFPSATQTATGSGSVPTKTSSSSASSSRKQPSRSVPTPVSAAYLLIGAWANGVVRKGVRRLSRAPVSSSSSSSTAIVSDSSTESSSLDSDSDQPHALSKSHPSTLQRVTHQACKSQRGLPCRTTSISHMPTEILFKVCRPTVDEKSVPLQLRVNFRFFAMFPPALLPPCCLRRHILLPWRRTF